MSNYIGITIGPIVETMMQTSTPAGLWYASYFFSSVSRDICIELQEKGYKILSLPMENSDRYRVSNHIKENEGIGRFHDRIYFKTENEWKEAEEDVRGTISSVNEKRASELNTCLGIEENSLPNNQNEFLQIHYICIPENMIEPKGIIATLSDTLDTLELAGTVVEEPENNPLYKVIKGKKDGSNLYIKNLDVLKNAVANNPERFLLASKDENDRVIIHDIEWIASHLKSESNARKTENYFAIVQCDGDNMGTIAKKESDGCGKGTGGKNFSNLCWEYTETAVDLITKYGGVVIYAGGDDLLFLAPVLGNSIGESKKMMTVWELCQKISAAFDLIFNDIYRDNLLGLNPKEAKPSLSFGVSINYNHFPLYEAFADARNLLFGIAKNYTEGREREKHKNNIALKVHKASGQSSGIACCMNTNKDAGKDPCSDVFAEYLSLINDFFVPDKGVEKSADYKDSEKEKNNVMHSLLYHLESSQSLFKEAMRVEEYAKNAYKKVFDNSQQFFGGEFVDRVSNLSIKVHNAHEKHLLTGLTMSSHSKEDDSDVYALTSMLRIAKFLLEDD